MASFFDNFETMERILELNDIVNSIMNRKIWRGKQIENPLEPFNPFEPQNPWKRRPMPQRPFRDSNSMNRIREPLSDVFVEKNSVNIYAYLPGKKKDDLRLNVTKGKVEIKAKNFYKMIKTPKNVDIEKASSNYHNGVLTIIIPKLHENMWEIKIE